jgi:hypothetical protein
MVFSIFCLHTFLVVGSEIRFFTYSYVLGRFKPGTCKNSKIDVMHCTIEQLRRPITCSIIDVVNMYKKIVSKWPVFECESEAANHPFFLTEK